jgi:hypothetical protein
MSYLGKLLSVYSLDIGFALFPFQSIDFISQTQILDLGVSQVSRNLSVQVQKPLDLLAGIFDFDTAEVNPVKHIEISLSGLCYTLRCWGFRFTPTIEMIPEYATLNSSN